MSILKTNEAIISIKFLAICTFAKATKSSDDFFFNFLLHAFCELNHERNTKGSKVAWRCWGSNLDPQIPIMMP